MPVHQGKRDPFENALRLGIQFCNSFKIVEICCKVGSVPYLKLIINYLNGFTFA